MEQQFVMQKGNSNDHRRTLPHSHFKETVSQCPGINKNNGKDLKKIVASDYRYHYILHFDSFMKNNAHTCEAISFIIIFTESFALLLKMRKYQATFCISFGKLRCMFLSNFPKKYCVHKKIH